MRFKYISDKIQPKNLKVVHCLFLAVLGNIRFGGRGLSLDTSLTLFYVSCEIRSKITLCWQYSDLHQPFWNGEHFMLNIV